MQWVLDRLRSLSGVRVEVRQRTDLVRSADAKSAPAADEYLLPAAAPQGALIQADHPKARSA